jgi:hypothetical protein
MKVSQTLSHLMWENISSNFLRWSYSIFYVVNFSKPKKIGYAINFNFWTNVTASDVILHNMLITLQCNILYMSHEKIVPHATHKLKNTITSHIPESSTLPSTLG